MLGLRRVGLHNFNLVLVYNFSSTTRSFKEMLKETDKFKLSSQNWLLRQINDKYVKQAKLENYRCRSAFKLLEINKKYKVFRPGQTVVDLGCAPGSWTQVAVNATKANSPKSKSLIVGIDLSPVHPVEGATLLSALDFTTESAQLQIMEVLGPRKVNVVMSDMAPSASGIKSMDHVNIIRLCYSALLFAQKVSSHGAILIMKVFDGDESKKLINDAKNMYESVLLVRPEASRKESSEIFFVCLKFKGNQRISDELDSIKEKQ